MLIAVRAETVSGDDEDEEHALQLPWTRAGSRMSETEAARSAPARALSLSRSRSRRCRSASCWREESWLHLGVAASNKPKQTQESALRAVYMIPESSIQRRINCKRDPRSSHRAQECTHTAQIGD